jgi:hypothetical protein
MSSGITCNASTLTVDFNTLNKEDKSGHMQEYGHATPRSELLTGITNPFEKQIATAIGETKIHPALMIRPHGTMHWQTIRLRLTFYVKAQLQRSTYT